MCGADSEVKEISGGWGERNSLISRVKRGSVRTYKEDEVERSYVWFYHYVSSAVKGKSTFLRPIRMLDIKTPAVKREHEAEASEDINVCFHSSGIDINTSTGEVCSAGVRTLNVMVFQPEKANVFLQCHILVSVTTLHDLMKPSFGSQLLFVGSFPVI